MSKEGKKRKRTAGGPLTGSQGWKTVDVGDELLIGSEEGGFMELEEFTPAPGVIVGALEPTEVEQDVMTQKKAKKVGDKHDQPKKKKKSGLKEGASEAALRKTSNAAEPKQKGSAAVEASPAEGSNDVAALMAQLAKLQAENAALKKGDAPGKAADPNSARSAKLAAKRAKAKEIRRVKKEAAKARKLRAASRSADEGAALLLLVSHAVIATLPGSSDSFFLYSAPCCACWACASCPRLTTTREQPLQ